MEYELSEIKLENELTLDLELDILKIEPKLEEKNIVENGEYIPQDEGLDGYSKVNVNVPIPKLEESQRIEIVENGNYNVTPNGDYDAIKKVEVNVNVPEPKLGTKTITANGTYKAIDDNLDGYSEVNVETTGVDIWDYFIQQGSGVFEIKRYIQKIPNFNLSGTINMYNGFKDCANLKEIPEMDTSNIQDFGYSFNGCASLISISKLNFQKANNITSMTLYCSNLTTLGGFENLGQNYSISQSENYYNYKLDLHYSTKLTEQSIINVLTNLYDIATKGVKPQQVILGATNLAKLVSEEGQQALQTATERGWNVS